MKKTVQQFQKEQLDKVIEKISRKHLLVTLINKRIKNWESARSIAKKLWINEFNMSKLRHDVTYSISDTRVKRFTKLLS